MPCKTCGKGEIREIKEIFTNFQHDKTIINAQNFKIIAYWLMTR
jgi:hypothetical protein